MKKIMRIGTIGTGNGRRASIFIKAELKEGNLSISGVIGPLSSGNALGGCGQISMEFEHRNAEDNDTRYSNLIKASSIKYAAGWDKEKWLDLLDIWEKWHLNNLKAGCEHQRALGWDKGGYDQHPSEPCPVCGYKYGSAWRRVEVPQDVINFLETLPDSDKQPSWI
jgi:hypothetical protein